MMKATAWFCPVLLTLLCATRLVCTAQRGAGGAGAGGSGAEAGGSSRINGYPLDYPDARNIQDDFLLAKRNKPSLSIVNPLDVLRQRLLLEIARRQMKENSRQVELNRAILKNVGKRMLVRGAPKVTARRYREREREPEELLQLQDELEAEEELELEEEEEQLRQQLLPWKQHFPSQQWSYGWTRTRAQSPYPASQLADSTLQRQHQQQQQTTRPQSQSLPGQKVGAAGQQLLSYAKKSLNVAGMGLGMRAVRHRANGNEAANETNHYNDDTENGYGFGSSKNAAGYVDAVDEDNTIDGDDGDGFDLFEEPNGAPAGVADANERLAPAWNFPYRFHKSQQQQQ
ncbi:hypothetical protein KR018_010066, partial [Drosophila ironensis]